MACNLRTRRTLCSTPPYPLCSLVANFHVFVQSENGSGKTGGRPDRSPIGRRGTAAADGGGTSNDHPQTSSPAAAAAGAVGAAAAAAAHGPASSAGRPGSEDILGPVGGWHLTKLVLKFTTASESDVQPSCEVSTKPNIRVVLRRSGLVCWGAWHSHLSSQGGGGGGALKN